MPNLEWFLIRRRTHLQPKLQARQALGPMCLGSLRTFWSPPLELLRAPIQSAARETRRCAIFDLFLLVFRVLLFCFFPFLSVPFFFFPFLSVSFLFFRRPFTFGLGFSRSSGCFHTRFFLVSVLRPKLGRKPCVLPKPVCQAANSSAFEPLVCFGNHGVFKPPIQSSYSSH